MSVTRGKEAEELACGFLKKHGLVLVERNFRCRLGEIDLVMRDADSLVFVEVRLRSNPNFGSGADSVGPRKQAKLTATAAYYLQRLTRPGRDLPARFDVVSIGPPARGHPKVEWIRDAFHAAP